MNDNYTYVAATREELSEWFKRNGRQPSVRRVMCKACGKRLWGSGMGIGSHSRACPGRTLHSQDEVETRASELERHRQSQVSKLNPKHAVFATTYEHARYRVSVWLDWNAAQDKWERLDDARRAGEFADRVKFFEVRSSDDPKYNGLPREDWRAWTNAELPKYVVLSRHEREQLLQIGRAEDTLENAADAMFTELVSDSRWAHLDAVTISNYSWAAARWAKNREARYW